MNEDLRAALDRAAGQDPHVDLAQQVWAQGRVVRRRRQAAQGFGAVAAAGVLAGAVWLGGGLLPGPDALPGPADRPDDGAAVSTAPDRTAEERTDEGRDEPTDALTDDGTEEPTDDATTQDPATQDPATEAPEGPFDPCGTPYPDPVLSADGLPAVATERAQEVLELAAACDLDGLAALALEDQTHLSFGVVTPEEVFSGEEGAERAAAVVAVLTLFEPGQDVPDAPYRWPAEMESEQDWAQLVDSGLYTQDEVDLMRESGIGYTGWRVGVDASGRWAFMVAGD